MSASSAAPKLFEPITPRATSGIGLAVFNPKDSLLTSGREQSFVDDQLVLRCGETVAAELSYRLFHNNQGNPWEKPIVIVHKALTGSTNAFTEGSASQGDGWGNFMKDLPKFNLDKYTILVVEPLGGNSQGLSPQHNCSGRDFFMNHGEIALSSYDTVTLLTKLLKTEGVDEVDNITCFSMGGITLPAWLTQTEIKIREIHNHFTNYQINDVTREYWQIQLDLLARPGVTPDFTQIASGLEKNLDVDCTCIENSTFNACIYYLKGKIEQLEKVHQTEDYDDYLNEALKVVRAVSFLRFQTPENYDVRTMGSSIDFLMNQAEAFPARMDPYSYVSLLKQMLDNSFPSPEELKLAKDPDTKITYILPEYEMIFPDPYACPETKLADKLHVILRSQTEDWGHDFFLSDLYSQVFRAMTGSR